MPGNLEGICSHSEGGRDQGAPGEQHRDGLIRPEKIFDLHGAGVRDIMKLPHDSQYFVCKLNTDEGRMMD